MGLMMEYYVFDNEQTATDALNYIANIGSYPIIGENMKTGNLEPNKQTAGARDIILQRLDGKFIFQRIPEFIRAQYPQSAKDYFSATFPHTVESFSSDWLNQEL